MGSTSVSDFGHSLPTRGDLLRCFALCHSHTLVVRHRELFLTTKLFLTAIEGELAVGVHHRLLLDPALLFIQLELPLLE